MEGGCISSSSLHPADHAKRMEDMHQYFGPHPVASPLEEPIKVLLLLEPVGSG